MQIDLEQLIMDAQASLDLDERYWDEDEGAFTWWGERVFFTKAADWIVLEVGGVEITCSRP